MANPNDNDRNDPKNPDDEVLGIPEACNGEIPDEVLDYSAALSLIAVGYYSLRIVKAEYLVSAPKENKRSKHMLPVEYEVTGAYITKNEPHIGAHITDYVVFSKATVQRAALFAREAGVEPPKVANRSTLENLASEIIGVEVSARITHELWNGDKRARVTSYGPPPENAPATK
jgi:hypothetical protein